MVYGGESRVPFYYRLASQLEPWGFALLSRYPEKKRILIYSTIRYDKITYEIVYQDKERRKEKHTP